MQPLVTKKKSCNLSGQKKITQSLKTKKSRNLLGQKKIMKPLGTNKIHVFSWDKENHATFQDKKKSHNLSGQKKNYATSLDKKIIQTFGKKNHTTSRDKQITQHVGTQKNLLPLRTKINKKLNKKIT